MAGTARAQGQDLTRADFEILLGLLRNILELIGAPVSVVCDIIQYLLLPLQFTVHLLHSIKL